MTTAKWIARPDQLRPLLAAAGIAGPVLFTLVFVAQGFAHPDYSHVALPVSALAAWPGGWMQNLNFFVFGVLTIGYAIGLHTGMRPARAGVLGPALLVLNGIGLLVAGLFPWRAIDGGFIVPTGHFVGALLAFSGAGAGFIVISRRMAADPRWQGLAGYSLVSGIAILALFIVIGAFARLPDAPLYPWLGLLQRLTLAIWFPCAIVLAIRLLRLDSPSSARPLPSEAQ